MTEHNSTLSNNDYKQKEMLYTLFYELTSEIKGCKIEIDEDEYQENIRTINFTQLINYVRDSIQILLKKKSDLIKEKEESISKLKLTVKKGDLLLYENLLRKYEDKERRLIKKQFQHRLQREAMENKLSELMEMEEEFEEMKTKLKYEDGKFLDNDRKDNEIIIIRSENTNLKKILTSLEAKVKVLEKNIELKNKENEDLQSKNLELNKKLEEKQKELNLFSNININISNCNQSNNNTPNISSHPLVEKCPFCNNNVTVSSSKRESKSLNPNESSPQLKVCHFQKVVPNLMKKSLTNSNNNTFLNQTSTSIISNNYTKIDQNDKAKNDFLAKYFTNRHSKSKSQLNHSSIKITRLPIGHLSNRSNAQIPPINQGSFNMNNINSYKQLFNNSINTNNRKTNRPNNTSLKLGLGGEGN